MTPTTPIDSGASSFRRFAGRRAPEIPGADLITREGYSHEVSSVGWWPGDELVKDPAFYSYAAPQPSGFPKAPVRPAAASYNTDLSQFLLSYDDVRGAASPRQAHRDRKSTRLNSSHLGISYAVFCLKKKKNNDQIF